MPPTPAGRHGGGEQLLRLHGAVDDDFVFLGEEVGFIGREDRLQRARSRSIAEQRLRSAVDRNRARRT